MLRRLDSIILPLLFAVSYSHSPLYLSNQNSYMLHGLANAGLGYLADDWMAGTADPTLLFSALVRWTYLWLGPNAFHFYQIVLVATYSAALWSIVSLNREMRDSRVAKIAFFAGLAVLHSPVLGRLSLKLLGTNISQLLHNGVAGQYVLGPVFQPSVFGVLLLVSIALFLRERYAWAVICLAASAAVHPTYLLSSGLLLGSYVLVRAHRDRNAVGSLGMAVLYGVLVTPIVYYVTTRFAPDSYSVLARAQEIMVESRMPHHALPTVWFGRGAVTKIVLVAGGLIFVRGTRLFPILGVPAIAAVLLTVTQVATGSYTLALLFPWRVSTVLVPVATAVLLSRAIAFVRSRRWIVKRERMLAWACVAAISVASAAGVYVFRWRTQRLIHDPDSPILEYAKNHASPGQLYLVPPRLERFRLSTGIPVLVDVKTHPYKDVEVLEWSARLELVRRFYESDDDDVSCRHLGKIIEEFAPTHIIADVDRFMSCPLVRRQARIGTSSILEIVPRSTVRVRTRPTET